MMISKDNKFSAYETAKSIVYDFRICFDLVDSMIHLDIGLFIIKLNTYKKDTAIELFPYEIIKQAIIIRFQSLSDTLWSPKCVTAPSGRRHVVPFTSFFF
jgi:hypothetical protein